MSGRRVVRMAFVVVSLAAVSVHLPEAAGRGSVLRPSAGGLSSQDPGQLVPVVTDQTNLPLGNTYGVPTGGSLNHAGDFVFGNPFAIFVRRAGEPAAVRVWQYGDELSSAPGSRSELSSSTPRINANGAVAFDTRSSAESVVVRWNGSTIDTVVSGLDVAPASGGARFGLIQLEGFNDAGNVLFRSFLEPLAAGPSVFLIPAGQEPIRLAGFGDVAPDTGGGTLGLIAVEGFNNAGEALLAAAISGGSGGLGLFVASATGVRKVVATGDARPTGGTFVAPGGGFLNATGQVAFADGGAVWVHSVAGGVAVAAAAGSPLSIGGMTNANTQPFLRAFNDAGDVAFTQGVTPSTVTTLALLRARVGAALEVVAYRNQIPPGGGSTLFNFSAVSMNINGLLTFEGWDTASSVGLFQQARGAATVSLVRTGDPTGTPLGGTFLLSATLSTSTTTQTLDDGSVYFRSDLDGSAADHAGFRLMPGGTQVLMSTAEALPAGARTVFRTLFMEAAGDHIGFPAQRAGGRVGLAAHSLATGLTRMVASDGDPSPLPQGGRLRIGGTGTSVNVALNASGLVPFNATIRGGTNPGTAIFVSGPGSPAIKVAAHGDLDSQGRVLGSPSFAQSGGSRVINASGDVVFGAAINGGSRGIFVGTGGGSPVKVAMLGDVVSTGATITSLFTLNFPPAVTLNPVINDDGLVLFGAGTTGGTFGLFVGGDGPPVKIVQTGDPAPGGGTFTRFFQPVFGTGGDVAFMATLSAGAGIFSYSPGSGLTAIALNGESAPGGGSYDIATRNDRLFLDVLLNDQKDLLFISDLAGGLSDSGYFIRRGADGSVAPLARQGDPAPGTNGVFTTFQHTINNWVGEVFHLSDRGDAAFLGGSIADGNTTFGKWYASPSGSMVPAILAGVASPELGGGVVLSWSQRAAFASGGRLALRVWLGGDGDFTDVIAVFVPPVADTVAPTLSVTLTPSTIWPPTQQLVEVAATIEVTDNVDPKPQVQLVSITANEALAADDIADAAFGTDDRSFRLRATRLPAGSGRTYTVTYRAADSSGNTTLRSATVLVPRNR